jgi:predicted ester cyclase
MSDPLLDRRRQQNDAEDERKVTEAVRVAREVSALDTTVPAEGVVERRLCKSAATALTISRGIMVVEGDYAACQTTIPGTFAREFTRSPVGPLPPNGSRVVFGLMNIFRYDEEGRLAEEWLQTDNRSRLRQLGAEGR